MYIIQHYGRLAKTKMVNSPYSYDYKDTLLGPIPVEWEVVKIGDLANVRYGKANPKSYGHIPVVGSGGVFSSTDEPLVEYPTLVVGRKGTAGKVWYMGGPSYPSDTAFYLEWKEQVDVGFLHGYMTLHPLSGEHAKTTIPSLTRPDLENYPVPYPPLPEQRLIAHVLSTVRNSIEATERVIAAARELKRSLMKYLFTYGSVPIDQADQVVLKETEVGEVPEGWDLKRINDIALVNAVSQDPSIELPNEYFTYIDISSVESETGQIVSSLRLLGSAAPSRARRVIRTNDIILSTVRPYLRAFALIPEEYNNQICSTGFAVLTAKDVISPNYLYYVTFSDMVGSQFASRMKGASYPAINSGDVKETNIPFPTVIDQRKIGVSLQAIDRKINIEIKQKKSLESLFSSLLHHLMTGKVRVSDLPTPNPSPAQNAGLCLKGGE